MERWRMSPDKGIKCAWWCSGKTVKPLYWRDKLRIYAEKKDWSNDSDEHREQPGWGKSCEHFGFNVSDNENYYGVLNNNVAYEFYSFHSGSNMKDDGLDETRAEIGTNSTSDDGNWEKWVGVKSAER